MTHHGAGDRWLAGQAVDGVRFAHNARAVIAEGAHAGERGTVTLLLRLAPEPVYLVTLASGETVRVKQGALREE